MRDLELDFFLNFSGHVPNAPWNRAQAIISFFVRQSSANAERKESLASLRRYARGSSTITLYKGNACVSRADERVLAIANFPADNIASIGRLAQYLVNVVR